MKTDFQPQLIAHRGWSSVFPENSLPAFAAAISAGADEIEFDVRLTKDNVPVLCHDETVDRVSTLSGPVHAFTASELKHANIRMPAGDIAHGLGFTFLQSALQLFLGTAGMNIHIKESANPHAILEILAESRLTDTGRSIYIAGSPAVLELALQICPDIPRCCLDSYNDPAGMLESAIALRCARVQFRRTNFSDADVRQARGLGLIPNLYYADDPTEAEHAISSGILGLLTNDVGQIGSHLAQAGLRMRREPAVLR